ncbi:MAG TPA: hypothetical protein ENJ51_07830 [Leucothrix mucor]|uniref:DUF11 domain-containing protein n=1 Tax=Leucothrix mucor TaxID=45248 RepID=A0A7V2WVH3_LEUMU|nr:hypothetical protein [Leucothrix mucor]
MLIKTFIIVALLMPFASIQAQAASESALSVRLQQAVDANCDGVSDNAFSSKPSSQFIILPQQCLIYKITAQNHSNQPLTNIILTGKIPQYTQLKPNSIFVYENEKLSPVVAYQSSDSPQVKAELTTLAPFKSIVIIYSVLIHF